MREYRAMRINELGRLGHSLTLHKPWRYKALKGLTNAPHLLIPRKSCKYVGCQLTN
jgi:hypothetical protein